MYLLRYSAQDLDDALAGIEGLSDHRYWNNTDRPTGISAADWDARRADWDRVVGADTPVTRGLCWELEDLSFESVLSERDAVLAELPDRRSRAQAVATSRHAQAALRQAAQRAERAGRQLTASEIMGEITRAREEVSADAGRIERLAESLTEIDWDVLTGRSPRTPRP